MISLTQDTIRKATPQNLHSAARRLFRPDQAILVVIGDFDAGRMLKSAEMSLGDWDVVRQAPVPANEKPSFEPKHAVHFVGRPDSLQTTLALGAAEGDPDYAAARVANAIFGGMFGSRVTLSIR